MNHLQHHRPTRRLGAALALAASVAAAAVTGIALGSHQAGAAVAVQAGGSVSSEFVALTPCRLMDTRPGSNNVGPRATPLGQGETHVQQVTGANGNCSVPTSAVAVALNATAVGGTQTSYLTFFPDDADLPLSSNLNFGPGQAPTPNKVDVRLSANGSLGIYNAFGQVHVVVDVMGYYLPVAPTPFATTAHDDGRTLSSNATTIVWLEVDAPSDGAVVASSFAQFDTLAGGRIDCSISDTTALDSDHRQVWRTTSGGPGSVSGSRTFQVQAGQTLEVRLVCQLVSGSAGINEADLSAMFVPSFVAQNHSATG